VRNGVPRYYHRAEEQVLPVLNAEMNRRREVFRPYGVLED
jgi:hypothetical protein